jgi:16S rRNA (guanine527-N7)-methyltransferase
MPDRDGFGPDQILEQYDVSRETIDSIIKVVDELDGWRKKINLLGPAEYEQVWRRHVLDSIQLLPLIPQDSVTVDLGSGSGFPALVLAAGLSHDDAGIVMIETVGKKCAFLRAAAKAANLPAIVRQGRVENVKDVHAACVTARAFAPLPKLLEYSEKWFDQGAYGIFPKGRRWEEELTQAKEYWRFAYEVIPSISGGDGVILKISEVSRVRP